MISRHSVLALAVVVAVAFAHTASAEPTPAQLAQAQAHFEQGKAFLDATVYDKAIEEFEAAYKLSPFPELVFNVGQAYRLANQPEKALTAYQEYLRSTPTGQVADEVRVHIANLTKAIEQRRDAEAAERQRQEAQRAQLSAETRERFTRQQAAYDHDHELRASASFRRHGGYLTAGLGGAALVGGIVVIVTTSSSSATGFGTGTGIGVGLVLAGFVAGAIGAVVALTAEDPPGQPVQPPPPLTSRGPHDFSGSWSWHF